MKIVVGLDEEGKYKTALELLRRASFPGVEFSLVHVAQQSSGSGTLDRAALEAASNDLRASGVKTSVVLLEGSPAKALLTYADEISADLIAIGSEVHGRIGSVLVGSVGRAVSLGNKSFLIARGDLSTTGPLKVVFATDFSDYARRALDLIVKTKPLGIGEAIILTARDMRELSEMAQYLNLLDDANADGSSFQEVLRKHGHEAVEQLRNAGISASAEMRDGSVSHAINESMEAHKADLLVLGAQGHGFLERLVIGSVALEQVVSGSHSILVIRS
jgi:nucleotide-binding universal stress UspA family protein